MATTATTTVTMATTDPLADIVKVAKEARLRASVVFPFDPVPASRPKVSRWGVYYGKTYKNWKQLAEDYLAPGDTGIAPTDGVLVVIIAVAKRAKTSKAVFPNGDVDNFAKGPMDVITKATGYWGDDKQVTWLLSGKRFAEPGEEPRTEVHIYTT